MRFAGRERRVYALVASLPYSGAQTAFFSLEMTIESFLEGHVRAFEWLGGVGGVVIGVFADCRIGVLADDPGARDRHCCWMAGRGHAESYAAIWREREGAIACGKVVLEPDGLRLEGATSGGQFSRRELFYTEVLGVRIGRGRVSG